MVNNMRLIDADRLCMYLADLQLANRGWKDDFCEILDDLMESLDEQPTIDAVPVVRCKDCKYWSRDRANIHRGYCLEIVPEAWMNENDFCSYGEPRGERKE